MAVPDDKSSFITTPHFFAHIYATHASKIIEEYVATDKKDQISRAKIEFDIIRVLDEDPNLPLKYKMSCTSMILHTDTFEPFWGDQRLAYTLSAKSLKRLKPNYKLINQIPCPSPDDDATTALSSSLGNLTDQNVNSRNQPTTTAKNKGKGGRGSRAATAKTNGRAPRKATTTTTAAANRKRATVAQKAPKTAKSGAGNGKSNANANVTATVNGVTSTTNTTVPATTARRTGRPQGKTPQEAYVECMAQKDDMHIRGPTSDEEETSIDDDSDSD
ncbi:hypothetical protein TCE0_034r10233 [Talaromyces pinophilus]|uniref:Uncharacterized protein n=1 Tax=Talaromyces pinophilus TaxID=128442 RepID=A0A6V8HEX5_TALPI|nr:hypothetical protein TCE0_034r10233 [Talaromyces pinophilus]